VLNVEDQIVHKIEPITNDDERKLIGQFGLLEEVLHTLRVVAVTLTANSLDFLDLSGLAGGFNVFEVDFWVLTKVNNRAKEVKKSLEALELLEQIDKSIGAQLFVVLCGNLHDHLQVLPDVGLQHGLQAFNGVFDREGSKKGDKPIGLQEVSVDHSTFDVIQVGVVLQSSLKKTCLLAETCNVRSVVVGEHLVAHDCV